MELQNAIKTIFEGNSLLFTGAGFSLSATNMNGTNFKSAYYLAENLYKECGENNDGDLENAVDIFLDKFGEIKLIEFLKNEFTVSTLSNELSVYGQVNWKRIYTTNYDNVIEAAYQKFGKVITPVTLTDRSIDYNKQNVCIHLNGNITNLNQSTLNSEFKLTNVSYLTQAFLESEWINLFSMDLSTADSVFFVGFSMKYDLDIKRLIYANPELKDKTFFIVAKNESASSLRLLAKFGTPIPIGVEEFSEKIINEKKAYIPPITKLEHYFSFKKTEISSKHLLPVVKDSDIFNLFVNGISNENLLYYSLQLPEKYPYYIFRSKFEKILEQLEHGEKNFVLHSDMGNGKSLFLNGLKIYLYQKGYKVYEYYKFYSPVYRELETICNNSDDKTILILDSYTNDWQLLDVIKLHGKDLILITTERSLIFDATGDKLETIIGEYSVYDINSLDSKEIDTISEVFNIYGFWQQMSSAPIHIKRKFIENTCRKEFRVLLLKLLDSPDILHRFESIITDIKGKKGFYDALVFVLISNVYGFDLDLENLAYTLGYDVINNSSFVRNPQIREFIDFEKGIITIKSSILSTIILSKIVDSYILVDTILKIFIKLDKHNSQQPYRNILKSFVSFSNLQRILDKTDRSYKYNMLRFFEGIRNTDFCQKNPHFWLQYAIEKLSEREYPTAKTYFETAYSYANNITGYDTYQIDNHFARYILEFAIESGQKDDCLDDFMKAHRILMDPLHEKIVKYYPFRVAQNYLPFYTKFFDDFNDSQKAIFLQACEQLLEKIERYVVRVPKYSNSKDVKTARANFNFILSRNVD
jgi:hypothetical protein